MWRRCGDSICKCPRDRSSASWEGTAPARRRRIKVLLGMARPTQGRGARVRTLAADSDAGVEIRRRTAFVSDEKDLYDYMTVGEIVAFTRSFYPRWRADLEQQYLRKFDLSPGRDIKALSRGTRTKLALLLALCRGAELLMLDEPTSGLDPAMAEEVLQALVSHVGRRRIDGLLLVASARRSRADRRSRRDHRSRPDRGRPARSTICARSISASSWCSRATHRRSRCMRPARTACAARAASSRCSPSSGGTAVIEELRGYRPRRSMSSPVTPERHFSRVGTNGGLTCSGTKRGLKHGGASSARC